MKSSGKIVMCIHTKAKASSQHVLVFIIQICCPHLPWECSVKAMLKFMCVYISISALYIRIHMIMRCVTLTPVYAD